MFIRPPFKKFQGGTGFYPATPTHPPLVHIDIRGSRSRWQGETHSSFYSGTIFISAFDVQK